MLFILCAYCTAFSADELPEPSEIVNAVGHLSHDGVHPGMEFKIGIICELMEGWHVNSHTPAEDVFVPTEVIVEVPPEIKSKEPWYPKGVLREFSFSEEPLSVYEDEFTIVIGATLSSSAEPSELVMNVMLRYQPCDDRMCLEPVEKALAVPVRVVGLNTPISSSGLGIFAIEDEETESPGGFGSRGMALTFVLIFVGGLALNLTPCIYPMIPITISYFGGQSHGNQRRLFLLAVMYVVGIAITYSVVGVVAALTGSLLGAAMQNPIVLAFVAVVLLVLALSMFDVYALRMPGAVTRMAGSSRGGIIGSTFMGLTLGIVIAPCVGPFVLGLLTYVGRLGNPLLGFWMFFTLAMGMGLPLVFLGVLSGSMNKLPRSGDWMVWVKKVFGFILLAMSLYFLRTLLPGPLYWLALAVITFCGAVYLGWLEKVQGMGTAFKISRRVLGVTSLLAALWLVVAPGHTFVAKRSADSIGWEPYTDDMVIEARKAGRPVLIDFSAKWCVPCLELDEKTFSDPRVMERASRFVALRVDLTAGAKEEGKRLMDRFKVVGVPTLLFFGPDGEELSELRSVGYIGPDSIITLMDEAVSKKHGKVGAN